MKPVLLILGIVLSVAIVAHCARMVHPGPDAEGYYDMCLQLHTDLGYPCEHHTVQTDDGWLLDVIRLPPKNRSAPSYPILLQHGYGAASAIWFMNARGYQNLATVLHDATDGSNYDVWMPNSRGGHYSMRNIHYPNASLRNDSYWRSSDMDFMAMYDLPANIDYILSHHPNRSTLSYVGHSQGTWQAFSAFSTVRRDYAKKVDLYVAFAPIAYIANTTNEGLRFDVAINLAGLAIKSGINLIKHDAPQVYKQSKKECTGQPDDACMRAMNAGDGYGNNTNFNQSAMIQVHRFLPAGTTMWNAEHWGQLVERGWDRMHDYGAKENVKLYGVPVPPKYELRNMTAPPTMLCAGVKDAMADPTDVARLISELPSSTLVRLLEFDNYNHMDFVWGLDAHLRLYPKVLAALKKYQRWP